MLCPRAEKSQRPFFTTMERLDDQLSLSFSGFAQGS
jgi:hypothetical protein